MTDLTPRISCPSVSVSFGDGDDDDDDVLSVARSISQSLRDRGADVIVALTHLCEAEDRLIAGDGGAGVDLVLGGHEHEPMAALVHRNDRRGGGGGGTTTTRRRGRGMRRRRRMRMKTGMAWI